MNCLNQTMARVCGLDGGGSRHVLSCPKASALPHAAESRPCRGVRRPRGQHALRGATGRCGRGRQEEHPGHRWGSSSPLAASNPRRSPPFNSPSIPAVNLSRPCLDSTAAFPRHQLPSATAHWPTAWTSTTRHRGGNTARARSSPRFWLWQSAIRDHWTRSDRRCCRRPGLVRPAALPCWLAQGLEPLDGLRGLRGCRGRSSAARTLLDADSNGFHAGEHAVQRRHGGGGRHWQQCARHLRGLPGPRCGRVRLPGSKRAPDAGGGTLRGTARGHAHLFRWLVRPRRSRERPWYGVSRLSRRCSSPGPRSAPRTVTSTPLSRS